MSAHFRDYLQRLIDISELVRVNEEVDLRHVSLRVAESNKALWFERVRGYDFGIVSGILGSRRRVAIGLDCDHRDIGKRFIERIRVRHTPVIKTGSPADEVVRTGNDVDLTALPVPLISQIDGGPYITGG